MLFMPALATPLVVVAVAGVVMVVVVVGLVFSPGMGRILGVGVARGLDGLAALERLGAPGLRGLVPQEPLCWAGEGRGRVSRREV
jgi:hypothetical protein